MAKDLIDIADVVMGELYSVYDYKEDLRDRKVIPIKRLRNGDIIALEFFDYFDGPEFEGTGVYYFDPDNSAGLFSWFYKNNDLSRYKKLKVLFDLIFKNKKIDLDP